MSDADRLQRLGKELARLAAESAIGELAPRTDSFRAYLRERLDNECGVDGSLLSDPVIEATFGWRQHDARMSELPSDLIHPQLVAAMDGPQGELAEHRFGADWHPYAHQVEAWRALRAEPPRSVMVTSGTGSGKTECFLVPILDGLAREREIRGRLSGVRALFLYPLNALINSQRDRLRAWTSGFSGDIRFCLYNGNTPETSPARLQTQSSEEVLDRKQLREDPPPLLVTNGTMLEYMLVRAADAPIIERSQGLLRYIVLDEAHTYVGSQAAEVALLLRRVLHAFGVASSDVRFIATSATIGDSDSEQAVARLRSYLADIAGVDPGQVTVIEGSREIPAHSATKAVSVFDVNKLRTLEPPERRQALAGQPVVNALRQSLSERPLRLSQIGKVLKQSTGGKVLTPGETLEVLDWLSETPESSDPLLPIRIHFFHRTIPGIWSCADPACEVKCNTTLDKGGWPFGAVYLERREKCGCSAPVFQVVLCTVCRTEFLSAREDLEEGGLNTLRPRELNADEFDDGEFDLVDEVGAEDDDSEAADALLMSRKRILAPLEFDAGTPQRLQKSSHELTADGDVPVNILFPGADTDDSNSFRCPRCRTSDSARRGLFRPSVVGADFFLSVAIPTLLDQTPPAPAPAARELPHSGRRLITFSDSRQGTARFAIRNQIEAERAYVRGHIYHQLAAARSGSSGGDRAQLEAEIADLQSAVEQGANSLQGLLDQKQAELLDSKAPAVGRLSFEKLAAALEKSDDVRVWMKTHWQHLQQGELVRNKEGRFCLLREFLRRPMRQASLETLGLARLVYPGLEANAQKKIPDLFLRRDLSNRDWADFLKVCMDFFVRGNVAVNVDRGLLQWMGVSIRTRQLVGPEADSSPRVARWPLIRQNGSRSRLVWLLARGLKLDPLDKTDKEDINSTLTQAWSRVREVLEQFSDGYQLRLEEHAEIEEVREAWLCPITRRLIDTTFLGLSPYLTPDLDLSSIRCQRVEMPALEYPFWREESGRALPLKDRENILDADPAVQRCIEIGAWGGQSRRTAFRPHYYRVGEHSAQQSSERLEALETEFKSGRMNLLSCSTTMEMGVDIGGLSTIAMNNAPPGPSNYRQRAGRAGRRGEPVAVSFTLCRGTPHGEAVFANPLWPFTTPTHIPTVSLDSARIAQRHVNALALTRFLRNESTDVHRLTCEWFFGTGSQENTARSPYDGFCDWLVDEAPDDQWLQAGIDQLLRRTAISSADTLHILQCVREEMRQAADQWRSEIGALVEALGEVGGKDKEEAATPAARSVQRQLRRGREEYLLKELATRCFLPVHGFPSSVVQFVKTTLSELHRESARRRQASADGARASSREDSFSRARGYPSRDLPLAIRDYAPGSDVVLDGEVFRSEGVTLNWHLPAGETEMSEIQAFRWAWRCRQCGASSTSPQMTDVCAVCSSEEGLLVRQSYLQPAGFAVDLTAEPTNDISRPNYLPVRRPWVSAGVSAWLDLPRPEIGRYRYSPAGQIFYHSNGANGHGYAICLRCGRSQSETSPPDALLKPVMREHTRLRGGKDEEKGGWRCIGNDQPYAIKRHQWFGFGQGTDLFEMQLNDLDSGTVPEAMSRGAALSVAIALRQATAEHLGINDRELGAEAIPARDRSGARTFSIVVYDTAAGGAGFAAQIPEALPALLRRAAAVLACHRECDRACHSCLLSYDTQFEAEALDRKAGLALIPPRVIDAFQLPQEAWILGPSSVLEYSALRTAVSSFLEKGRAEELRVYLGGERDDWDPLEWSLRDALLRYSGGGGRVAIVLREQDRHSLPEGVAGQLASLAEAGAFSIHVTPKEDPSPIAVECIHSEGVRRWAVLDESARAPGPDWGRSIEDARVVRADAPAGSCHGLGPEISSAALRPALPGTVRKIKVTSQLDGKIDGFGKRFWNVIIEAMPDIGTRLAEHPLAAVSFTDRYVHSPIVARQLREVAHHLRELATATAGRPAWNVQTLELARNFDRHSDQIGHNWNDKSARSWILKTLLIGAGFDAVLECGGKAKIPHYRQLRLDWRDGAHCEIGLDHGLGSTSPRGRYPFDFTANSKKQLNAIVRADVRVAARPNETTLIYLSPISRPAG